MTKRIGDIWYAYCPYCVVDRAYEGPSKKQAETKAKLHVRGQHPEMDNPFESDEI